MNAPSAWQIQQAVTCFLSLKNAEQIGADFADLEAELNNAEADIEALIVKSIRAMKEAECNANSAKERISDLQIRQSRFEIKAQAVRSVIFSVLDVLGWDKFQHPEFTVTIGKPRIGLLVTDESALPGEYIKTKSEPDKALILDALKAGTEVPGATLSNGLPYLTVRTK